MNKRIERQITEIYNAVWKKILNKKTYKYLFNNQTVQLDLLAQTLANSDKYNEFAKKFSKELAKVGLNSQRGIWKKYFEAAKINRHIALPSNYSEFEKQQLTKAIQHNFKMIKTIPSKVMEVINQKGSQTLIKQVAEGSLPRGSFQRELQKHGSKNAKVIARTETAKLQTAITESNALDLGSKAYIWISSNDKRTRPSHKEMNGVVVLWRPDNQKPILDNMQGNAGEFPNCRCDTQPIFDEDDLTKAQYKIYNYNTNKINTISKKELINILIRGEL